jgi:cephalosporin hydroxylase
MALRLWYILTIRLSLKKEALEMPQGFLTPLKRAIITFNKRLIYHRLFLNPNTEKQIIDQFHKFYYDSSKFQGGYEDTYWLGAKIQKCPLDMWIYQEIIFEVKPDIIIECGTAFGGSAFFMAAMCDLVKKGKIITIDVEIRENRPRHDRITYLTGSSVSDEIVGKVKGSIKGGDKILIFLDSDHSKDHVLEELNIYSKFVTVGSYLVVEDTNLNGHPVFPNFGPGPMEAIEDFLKGNNDFIVDKSKEKFYLTFNPGGYLKRVK